MLKNIKKTLSYGRNITKPSDSKRLKLNRMTTIEKCRTDGQLKVKLLVVTMLE